MSHPRATGRGRLASSVSAVLLAVAACTSSLPPPATVVPTATPSPTPATVVPTATPSPTPAAPTDPLATNPPTTASPVPSVSPTPGPSGSVPPSPSPTPASTISNGSDGRLTVLLLGSDQRAGYEGERTDVMIVASIDPNSRRISLAAISRDAVGFPLSPRNGGGTTGAEKINGRYVVYKRPRFRSLEAIDPRALRRFRDDIAFALGIEIDYHAFIRFTGFTALVDHVRGIRVNIARTIFDPVYGAHPDGPRGIFFPAARRYLLHGNPLCRGIPYDPEHYCRSALVYARTRKGVEGALPNSTALRARRDVQLVLAAIKRVLQRGDDASLEALLVASAGHVTTDLPRTLADGLHLFQLLRGARSLPEDRTIFWPPDFGIDDRDASGAFVDRLDIARVRAWSDIHFGPVAGAAGAPGATEAAP